MAKDRRWREWPRNLDVVFAADGMPDNGTFRSEASPCAAQLLNRHAKQHLSDVLDSTRGEGSSEAQHYFVRSRKIPKDELDASSGRYAASNPNIHAARPSPAC